MMHPSIWNPYAAPVIWNLMSIGMTLKQLLINNFSKTVFFFKVNMSFYSLDETNEFTVQTTTLQMYVSIVVQKKIKYYVSEFKSHYYCGALASHMTSPNSSPNIFGGNWVQPSQFGQLEHWLSTKKKVLKKLRREIKYHILKSNTQILIIFPQFLMVLFWICTKMWKEMVRMDCNTFFSLKRPNISPQN